jgi:hypothetical protein
VPGATPLVAVSLAETALACNQAAAALALLRTSYEQVPALDTMEAIVRLEAASSGDGREGYIRHLEHEPSLIAAARWIAGEKLEHDQFHPLVQRALDHAVKPLSRYRCAACGFEAKDHFWQCPGCQAWDSYPRVIGRQQQLLRLDFESPPEGEVLAAQLDAFGELMPGHHAVLFSDYGKGGLAHMAAMIAAARAAGKPVLVDPKGADYSRYRHATVITPNRSELQQVVGAWLDEADLARRAQALRADLALDALLLTRSEEGMTLFDAQGSLHVPAQAREVFDVTGAGDTVIATLASFVAAGMELRAALPVANRAGGIVVGQIRNCQRHATTSCLAHETADPPTHSQRASAAR